MVDKKIIKQLEKYLGEGKVFGRREYLITYSYDATGREFLPDLVVFPDCEEDIRETLKIACAYKIPITPRGAGGGLFRRVGSRQWRNRHGVYQDEPHPVHRYGKISWPRWNRVW